MKLLINGYTITENLKLNKNNEDIRIAEIILEHLKKNRFAYAKLVLITALMLHYNINFIFANDFASSLDRVGNQIVSMLASFAKWGCIGMGMKSMVTTLLNGGNMKQAMTEGIQYWIGYLFIQFYPQLFDLFSSITFK